VRVIVRPGAGVLGVFRDVREIGESVVAVDNVRSQFLVPLEMKPTKANFWAIGLGIVGNC
jgi:hypothetical protein